MLLPHKLFVLTPLVVMQQLLPILPQLGLLATHVPVCQSGLKDLSPGDVYWQKELGDEQMLFMLAVGKAGLMPRMYRLGQQGLPGAEPQSLGTARQVPASGMNRQAAQQGSVRGPVWGDIIVAGAEPQSLGTMRQMPASGMNRQAVQQGSIHEMVWGDIIVAGAEPQSLGTMRQVPASGMSRQAAQQGSIHETVWGDIIVAGAEPQSLGTMRQVPASGMNRHEQTNRAAGVRS
jgi:protein required for attachment to host cells